MQLSLTELQEMIQASVLEFLTHEYDFLKRAGSLGAPHALSPAVWRGFADMGWLGLPLPEADGGIDGRAMECGLLMRAFGRHLVVEPYLNSVLLGTRLLAALGTQAQREDWLARLVAGEARVVLAHDEADRLDPWTARGTRAREEGGGWLLDGAKSLVAGAPGADALLVSASCADGAASLFLVRPDAPGLALSARRTLDGGAAADLVLAGVPGVRVGDGADAAPVLRRLLAEAIVSLCWEASGAMHAALEQTAAYTRERVQFGQPLSKFQVIQHRLAEMAVCCEEALAACQLAALRIERDPASAPEMAALAKSKVGRGALYVAQQAVQLHGAMGVSEELAIASYYRKLLGFSQQYRDAGWFAGRYGELMLDGEAYRASRVLPNQKGNQHAS